jgi:hypothetical protein
MDWNKGSNLAIKSQDFSATDWQFLTATNLGDTETDPIGGSTAVNVSWSNGGAAYLYQSFAQTGAHTVSMYVKSNGGGNDFRLFGDGVGQNSSTFTATNEWQRFDFSFTGAGGSSWGIRGVDGQAANLLVAFAQLEPNASVGPYIPTFATAQTSEVLLPQGLTTGRDITGVNLFENVRKQGALNLDGNSWAEVHENASIDISDCSLEAWVYLLPETIGTWQTIFSKVDQANLQIYLNPSDQLRHYNSTTAETILDSTPFNKNEWNHFILVEDGSDVLTYVNGVLQSTKTISLQMDGDGIFFIGAHTTSGADAINAQLAQPRIYNRALTAEEVQRNYNAGKNTYTN